MSEVVWKTLSFYISLKRGKRVVKSELSDSIGVPVFQNSLTPLGYFGEANREKNTTFIICAGAAGEVGYCDTPFWAADDCFTVECTSKADNKYIYYLLLQIQPIIKSFVRKASIPRLSSESILKIRVKLPSAKQQQAIVDKLDTFTTLISRLESELELRQKQYEHYREELLNFEGDEEVEWKTLGDVCEIKGRIGFRGYTIDDQVDKGEGALSLSPGNIINGQLDFNTCTYISWEKYYESPEIIVNVGDVMFCKTGSTGKVVFINTLPCKATINPQLVLLKEITISAKYLNYVIGKSSVQNKIKSLAGVGSVPNISQAKLSTLIIPVPSKHRQEQIVSQLDTFEQLIAALKREIALRQKQYEYYREKLLTFK